MPLSEAHQQEFIPRLAHLAEEIARVNALRHRREALSVAQSQDVSALYLDSEADGALADAMKYLAWVAGSLPHLEIDLKHRRFLDPRDLSMDEILEVLLTMAPEGLKEGIRELLLRARRNEVFHVLAGFTRSRDTYPRLSAGGVWASIVQPPNAAVQDNGCSSPSLTHAAVTAPIFKHRIFAGQEAFPFPANGPHSTLHLRGCAVKMGHRHRQVTLSNEEVMHTSILDGNMVYGSSLDITRIILKEARLIDVSGRVVSSALHDCTVLSGEGLVMSGGEWVGGVLEIGHANVTLSGQFFLGTEVRVGTDLSGDSSPLFNGCDFTHARISDADLSVIASRSSHTCVFSDAQAAKIASDSGSERALLSPNEAKAAVGSIAIPSDRPIFKSRLHSDHEDPSRTDIAPAPILVSALSNPSTRNGKVRDERFLAPLSGLESANLPSRILFQKRLMDFVRGKDSLREEEMLRFLLDECGELGCVALGIDPGLLNIPIALFDLPPVARLPQLHPDGYQNPSYDFLAYEADDKQGESFLLSSVKNYPSTYRTGSAFSLLTHECISCINVRPTYYAQLQRLKHQLYKLCSQLIGYGRYLAVLVESHGYDFPKVVKQSSFTLTNFFHPNLPATLVARGKPPSDLVPNSVDIPGSGRGHIIVASGPNGKAGKTFFTDAVPRIIGQAQSGAPCPGNVTVPSHGLYDVTLCVPNIRSQAGGNESGMEDRARTVLEEFVERVKGHAAPNGAKPIRVLLTVDEIMKGVTDPEWGFRIECNFLEELMEMQGLNLTILLVCHDGRVTRAIKRRFGDSVTFLAPAGDGERELCRLVPAEEPAESTPELVLGERGLSRFCTLKPWMEEDAGKGIGIGKH